jgi:DNA polymerase
MLETDIRTARVYDIRNAGRHHRFTVSGKLVHNCGYGGSVGAMKAMGGANLTDEELKQIVDDWRKASPNIPRLWYRLENAAMDAIRTGAPVMANGLVFRYEGTPEGLRFLTVQLPSGRKLFYCNPFFGTNRFGNESLHYYGANTGNWCELETYGGKITENVVQAIARDCLAAAMKNIEAAGYQIVMHIHDEVILDVPADRADLDTVCKLMCQPIPWAEGLLLNADGFVGDYYKKD